MAGRHGLHTAGAVRRRGCAGRAVAVLGRRPRRAPGAQCRRVCRRLCRRGHGPGGGARARRPAREADGGPARGRRHGGRVRGRGRGGGGDRGFAPGRRGRHRRDQRAGEHGDLRPPRGGGGDRRGLRRARAPGREPACIPRLPFTAAGPDAGEPRGAGRQAPLRRASAAPGLEPHRRGDGGSGGRRLLAAARPAAGPVHGRPGDVAEGRMRRVRRDRPRHHAPRHGGRAVGGRPRPAAALAAPAEGRLGLSRGGRGGAVRAGPGRGLAGLRPRLCPRPARDPRVPLPAPPPLALSLAGGPGRRSRGADARPRGLSRRVARDRGPDRSPRRGARPGLGLDQRGDGQDVRLPGICGRRLLPLEPPRLLDRRSRLHRPGGGVRTAGPRAVGVRRGPRSRGQPAGGDPGPARPARPAGLHRDLHRSLAGSRSGLVPAGRRTDAALALPRAAL